MNATKFMYLLNFVNCVNNVEAIVREARHMGVDASTIVEELKELYEADCSTENLSDMIHANLLDIMDNLLDILEEEPVGTTYYKVVNSIYDCIKEYYFGE